MRKFSIALCFTLTLLISLQSGASEVPKRVISLSPNLTQIIYGIGAWDSVVGVTIYADFPAEVSDVPKVGGWVNPNMEAIVALKPDVVVLMKDQDNIFGQKLDNLGINKYVVDSNDSIEEILESINALGKLLGKEQEANKLASDISQELSSITLRTKDAKKKSVLIVVGRNPGTLEDIYVIGRNNYINELVELSGGENIVEINRMAIKLTKEAVLTLNPDVIIEINHEEPEQEEEILKIWNQLELSNAVKNDEVYILSSKVLLHPSQRIKQGAKVLTQILHPELVNASK